MWHRKNVLSSAPRLIADWQAYANQQGVPLMESLHAIDSAFAAISSSGSVSDKQTVFFFGVTGEGKSTLINYQLGIDYRIVREHGIRRAVKVDPMKTEPARTGDSPTSQTLYPEALLSSHDSWIYVDMPGFEETRGTLEAIAASVSTCALFSRISTVRCLCLVVSWPSLEETKMLSYRKAAESIGRIVSAHSETQNNLLLIVTKPTEDLQVSDVISRLSTLLAEAEGELSQHYVKITTQALLRNADKLMLADITCDEPRKSLIKSIKSCHPQPCTKYDVSSYVEQMRTFSRVCEFIFDDHSKLLAKRADLEKHKRTTELKIGSIQELLDDLRKRIAADKAQTFTFDDSRVQQQFAGATKKLEEVARERQELLKEIEMLEDDRREKQRELDGISVEHQGLLTHRGILEYDRREKQRKIEESQSGKNSTMVSEILAQCQSERDHDRAYARIIEGMEDEVADLSRRKYRIDMKGELSDLSRRKYIIDMKGELSDLSRRLYIIDQLRNIDRIDQELTENQNRLSQLQDLNPQIRNIGIIDRKLIKNQNKLWQLQDTERQRHIECARIKESMENTRAHNEASVKIISKKLEIMGLEYRKYEHEFSVLQSDLESIINELSLYDSELTMSQGIFSSIQEIAKFIQRPQTKALPVTTQLATVFAAAARREKPRVRFFLPTPATHPSQARKAVPGIDQVAVNQLFLDVGSVSPTRNDVKQKSGTVATI